MVNEDCQSGGLQWIDRRQVIGIVPQLYNELFRYDGITASLDRFVLNPELNQVALSAAVVPGWGTLVGTVLGSLFIESDGDWTQIQTFALGPIRFLTALDESALCSARNAIDRVHPTEGVCRSTIPLEQDVTAIVAVGHERLVLSKDRTH